MMKKMPSGYGMVQTAVMEMDISVEAKAIYCLLASYTGSKRFCWPSQNRICESLKISKSTVVRRLKELEDCGLLRKEKLKPGTFVRNNKYEIYCLDDPQSVCETPSIESPETLTKESPETLTMNSTNEQYQKNSNNIYKPLPDAENVKITENDYQQLVKKYGNTVIQNIILDLDNYIVNGKGKKYKDHKRVIETWLRHRGVAPLKPVETVQEAREREERQRAEREALKAQKGAASGAV